MTGKGIVLALSLLLLSCGEGQFRLPFGPSDSSGQTISNNRSVADDPDNFGQNLESERPNNSTETADQYVLFIEHLKLFNSLDQNYTQSINGVELTQIRGWLANIYPWNYYPSEDTVHPISRLWLPGGKPNMVEQCRQIREFGAGAVVLQYNPNPNEDNHNYWLSTGFAASCGPFFVAYEHINGTRYAEGNDQGKNMDLEVNRQVFRQDIDFIFNEAIIRNQSRYVTLNNRAVIYMWNSSAMRGDFAGLLEEVKNKYPISFIGSGGEIFNIPSNRNDVARVEALDGFMEYTLGGVENYFQMAKDYINASHRWRGYLRNLETRNNKRHLFIPTFQAAYDDTKLPGRTTPHMYPRNVGEIEFHAQTIQQRIGVEFDAPPFVVYGELKEGAAVIESQLPPEPGRRLKECSASQLQRLDLNSRMVLCGYAGYGTGRLEILKKYFGQ